MQLINESPLEWISETLGIHKAQIKWAVTHEMARTVEDVLARRTRALLLDARETLRISFRVAQTMASVLNRDQDWINFQEEEFRELATRYLP